MRGYVISSTFWSKLCFFRVTYCAEILMQTCMSQNHRLYRDGTHQILAGVSPLCIFIRKKLVLQWKMTWFFWLIYFNPQVIVNCLWTWSSWSSHLSELIHNLSRHTFTSCSGHLVYGKSDVPNASALLIHTLRFMIVYPSWICLWRPIDYQKKKVAILDWEKDRFHYFGQR